MWTLTFACGGTKIDSFSGKYRGNQENIPVEKLLGAVEIWHVSVPRTYRSAVNVPSKPVKVKGAASSIDSDFAVASTLGSRAPYPLPNPAPYVPLGENSSTTCRRLSLILVR